MRERDLKALEFDKVIHLVMELCASEPGREASAQLRPSIDAAEVRSRLAATAEMVELRSHAGSIPLGEFADQRPYILAAARADAMLAALADDGTILDDASPELRRLRNRLRDERAELEARLLRSLNTSGME